MYVPRHFSMTDPAVAQLLATADTADLITTHPDGMHATYLPHLYDPEPGPYGRLIFHLQKNNPQVREPVTGPGLVIVHGPDHYVSPHGLPSTVEHGRVVPTWDYVTAHVRGDIVVHREAQWVRAAVEDLTARHEGADGWRPGEWMERLLPAIVGVEVLITSWEGKAKMAQNKSVADLEVLIARLEAAGDAEGAAFLREVSLPYARHRESLLADAAVGRARGRNLLDG